MDLNLVSIGYLFLRLAPFILVCFFVLTSIFNQDFRGLIYLAGLLFTCFISIAAGSSIGTPQTNNENECSNISIGIIKVPSLPISQTILCFTFFYLLIPIVVPDERFGNITLISQNITTIVFFVLLIVLDLWWNITYGCYNILILLLTIIISGGIGVLWAYIIKSFGNPALSYFNTSINGNPLCTAPSKQTFKCNVYKNGKLLSNNLGVPT